MSTKHKPEDRRHALAGETACLYCNAVVAKPGALVCYLHDFYGTGTGFPAKAGAR